MTNKVKTIAFLLATTLSLSLFTVFSGVSAEDDADPTSVEKKDTEPSDKAEETGIGILTHYADGRTEESVFVPPESTISYNSYTERVLESYDPLGIEDNKSTYQGVSEDTHGLTRVTPVDPRYGRLDVNFDVDGNGSVDAFVNGSASLQGHDIVISAAHVVWNSKYGSRWPVSITFHAGQNSKYTYSASSSYSKVAIATEFIERDKQNKDVCGYDWAIITINDDLGSEYGWLGLHGCSSKKLNLPVDFIGYPAELSFGAYPWKSSGIITEVKDNAITMSNYSTKGFSGSPITNNGNIYGISTHYIHDSEGNCIGSIGTRMFDALYDMIYKAREESKERWEK